MGERIKTAEMWTGLLVEKLLQTLPPLLDERVIKYAIVPSKWKLTEKSFSWERRYDHLRNTEHRRKAPVTKAQIIH